MNPMPFIIASYALGIIVPTVLALAALIRLRHAERRCLALGVRTERRR